MAGRYSFTKQQGTKFADSSSCEFPASEIVRNNFFWFYAVHFVTFCYNSKNGQRLSCLMLFHVNSGMNIKQSFIQPMAKAHVYTPSQQTWLSFLATLRLLDSTAPGQPPWWGNARGIYLGWIKLGTARCSLSTMSASALTPCNSHKKRSEQVIC